MLPCCSSSIKRSIEAKCAEFFLPLHLEKISDENTLYSSGLLVTCIGNTGHLPAGVAHHAVPSVVGGDVYAWFAQAVRLAHEPQASGTIHKELQGT